MTHQPSKTVRSDLLVHWTGKCIQRNHEALNQQQRQEYIERLCSILDSGLWINCMSIDISHATPKRDLSFPWPATSFTETKLPEAEAHTGYYGCLGFGFTREFVMKRNGAPVLYVSGTKEQECKGASDCISQHFIKLLRVLDFFRLATSDPRYLGHAEFIRFIQDINLEQYLQDESLDKRRAKDIFTSLSSSIMTCAIFVKRMSDEDCEYAYQRLDEAEWRLPWTMNLEEITVDPRMVDVNGKSHSFPCPNPAGRIPFYPSDLKALVLPDECTRQMVLGDQNILNRFGTELPRIKGIITTVADCLDGKFAPNDP